MLEGCSRKAGSGTGIAERTKYGNLDKPALKEGDGFLTGFKAYKQTQGGGRLSRGALVRKSLENQLEFSQQGRLFREISSFVEEVPPLGTHCRGEEIMKTTALKDSLWGFFPQLLFDDRSGWSDWSSQFHWKLFAPFGFFWDHQPLTGKALALHLPGWGCVAPISWELLPSDGQTPKLSLALRSHQSSPISNVS